MLADGTGPLNWRSYFVYSTDGGAIWNPAASCFMRGGAEASSWGYSATNASDVVALNAATPYRFGMAVDRDFGTGNAANSQCALSVELE